MELSARFVRDYLAAAEQLGVSAAVSLGSGRLTRDQVNAADGRIRWDDFAELSDRIGAALGSNERIEEFGALAVSLSSPWVFRHLVSRVLSPSLVLRIAFQFTGPAVFPSSHELTRRADGTFRLVLSVPPPYKGSLTYFRCCVGGIRSIPTVMGHPPALVVLAAIGPRGATYDITPPPTRTVTGRLRSAVRALRGESVLFEEVARQHAAMQSVFGTLLRTESELHQLMERIPDPLFVHRDGVILWANQALLTALKHESLDAVRGRHAADFVSPEDRSASIRQLTAPLAEAKGRTLRVRAADGTLRTFETSPSQSVIFDEVPARMELARDVTERDALREQLLLADRMSQLGFLAAGVAHEINNPLAYALAALDRARSDLDRGREGAVASSLAIAFEGAERVRRITNDLRVFARGGESPLEPVDLAEVLRATTDLAAASIRTRGQLTVSVGALPRVLGDPGRLGQVFMNLLVNAIDALEHGDLRTNRILVRAFTAEDGSAVVEVEDNGHGIPSEALCRIFEPFFTTKSAQSGSGLGLSICQRIVSDAGGKIDVTPGSQGGTVFRVRLPPHDGSAAVPPSEARGGTRLRVLVVEDEAPTLEGA